MWKLFASGIILLAVMEGAVWYVLKMNRADVQEKPLAVEHETSVAVPQEKTSEPEITASQEIKPSSPTPTEVLNEYPKITTEVVSGRTERTIHMGVRKWVWEPSTLRAKQGELVRLVIHNADVRHPLVIPDLGIEADVPPEGAVVEFVASKKGSFDFLCGTYCGVGHAEMQGTLIVD